MYEIFDRLLKAKGVRVSDVCAATGIAQSTFSDWKSGRSKPKAGKLQKIADYFGVSIDYLMTGKDSDPDAGHLIVSDPDEKEVVTRYRAADFVTKAMVHKALDIPEKGLSGQSAESSAS